LVNKRRSFLVAPLIVLLCSMLGGMYGPTIAGALGLRSRSVGLDVAVLPVFTLVVRFGAEIDLVLITVIAQEQALGAIGN